MANAALRLLAAPPAEPPYDGGPGVSSKVRSGRQASLPLSFAPERAVGRRSVQTPGQPTSTAGRGIAEDLADLQQWRRTRRADLCDPHPWAVRLARGIAEVIAGARSPRQLSAWLTADALEVLVSAAERQRVQDKVAPRPRTYGSAAPVRARSRRPAPRVLVRSVRVLEPSDGACEISVHLRIGERSRAIAVRAEGRNERWMCTALEIG